MNASQQFKHGLMDFRNNEAEFKLFIKQHHLAMFNAALNMLQSHEDAEDIAQDVFVDVYNKPLDFKGNAAVGTWLYRITINKCIDLLRKKERHRKWQSIGSLIGFKGEDVLTGNFVHPGTLAENKEKAAILYKAINQLPVNQRTAFVLCETEHLSYKEISEVMELTVSAVESLIVRSKKNLRQILAGYYKS